MRKIKFSERGDTLVEVMVSIAVLALVIVGCMEIMNRASGDMLNAVQRTEVRTDINSQTEMLNYIRDAHLKATQGSGNANEKFDSLWGNLQILAYPDGTPGVTDPCSFNPNGNLATKSPGSFYITRNTTDGLAVVMATKGTTDKSRAIPGDGMWIDAVRSPSGAAVPYTDFFVKACWRSSSGGVDRQSSTVVRLYDK